MFRIGQKVLCVDATPSAGRLTDTKWPLRKDEIYTVRKIGLHPHDGRQTICLTEIYEDDKDDSGFYQIRFRPLIERKTDTGMAILREILDRESHHDKAPKHERASRER